MYVSVTGLYDPEPELFSSSSSPELSFLLPLPVSIASAGERWINIWNIFQNIVTVLIKGCTRHSMIKPQYVNKKKLNKCKWKPSVDTVFFLTLSIAGCKVRCWNLPLCRFQSNLSWKPQEIEEIHLHTIFRVV